MENDYNDKCSKMPKIEAFFQKRLLGQNKLLKIKLNSIALNSNYKTINIFKKNKDSNQKRINPEYFTINSNEAKTIFSYRHKNKDKYNYNIFELNNDLKRYTNNSTTFKSFQEKNNPYHPYSVDKVKRSFLLQINAEKEKKLNEKIIQLNSIRSLLYNNSNASANKNMSRNIYIHKNFKTFKKKYSKLFNNINITHISIPKYINKHNIKDLELRDEIDMSVYENDKLKKSIRISLLNDINHDVINYNLYLNYLKNITDRINFVEDIYMVPHIGNNLSLCRPFDNLEVLNKKLRNRNLLHRQVALSMNKICIIKELIKKKREEEMKKLMEKVEYKPNKKLIKSDSFENNINIYETKFEHFELTDYFWKFNNYTIINFANKKLKETIFSKNF